MAGFYMTERPGAQRLFAAQVMKIALGRKSDCIGAPVLCTTSASMELPTSATGIATPKNLIGLSVLFLLAAAVFGVMNGQKARTLKTAVVNAEAARDAIE